MRETNKKALFRGPSCAFRLPIADWRPLRYCACATKHGYISFHLTPHVNKAAGSSAELLTAKAESEKSCQEGFFRSVGHWAGKAGPGKRNTSEGATDYLLTDLRVDHCGTMLRGIAPEGEAFRVPGESHWVAGEAGTMTHHQSAATSANRLW